MCSLLYIAGMEIIEREGGKVMETTKIQVGTRVSYEDMANPRRSGTIAGITRWGHSQGVEQVGIGGQAEYRIEWDDGASDYSDLRQGGWRNETACDHAVTNENCTHYS